MELLTEDVSKSSKRPKSRAYKRVKVIFALVLFLMVGGFAFSYNTVTIDTTFEATAENGSLLTQIRQFIGIAPIPLEEEETDRINILLLGHGGFGHDGPELTDTIIIASLKPSTNEASLISVPRDLTVNLGKHGWRKINHANAFGGPEFAAQVIEETFGMQIPYYIKVDFNGLEQIVDTLGGLEINVQNSFKDYQYPTNDFHTTTIEFEAGKQRFSGEEVLQFVRSRHGTNGEASDFSRAARQQLVLESIKEQALSLGLLLKPNKINSYLKTIDSNMETNLKAWEIARLAGIARDVDSGSIKKIVLNDGPGGLLTSRLTPEGAYILIPRHDSFSEIAYEIEHIFTPEKERPEPVKVAIRNGTLVTGLASKVAELFEDKQFFVSQVANATRKDWNVTTIYKLSTKISRDELDDIAKEFSANVSLGLPSWLTIADQPNSTTTPSIPPSDILIIVGENTKL